MTRAIPAAGQSRSERSSFSSCPLQVGGDGQRLLGPKADCHVAPRTRSSECVSAFTEELLGHSVERVHFKLDVRRRAQKHQFHWLLRNRTFRGKYRASEKVASQRADF